MKIFKMAQLNGPMIRVLGNKQ